MLHQRFFPVKLCLAAALVGSSLTATAVRGPLYPSYDTIVVSGKGSKIFFKPSSTTGKLLSIDASPSSTFGITGDEESGECTLTVKQDPGATELVGWAVIKYEYNKQSYTDTSILIQPTVKCVNPKQGSGGKEFFVAFMQNAELQNSTLPTFYLYATSDSATNCTITYNDTQKSQDITLKGSNVTEIFKEEPTDKAEAYLNKMVSYNREAEVVRKKSLYVKTDKSVSLFAYNAGFQTSDASHVIPVDGLGDEYFTMSWDGNSGSKSTAATGDLYAPTQEMFLIIATEDTTLVTITPTAQTDGSVAGVTYSNDDKLADIPFTVRLNRGDTYLVKSKTMALPSIPEITTFAPSLTGTHIKANKRIAVFGGHKRAAMCPAGYGTRDHLYEQMLPLHSWGKRYAIVSTPYLGEQLYRIVAAYDNTTVNITDNKSGVVKTLTLNRGEFLTEAITRTDDAFTNPALSDGKAAYAYVEASRPVGVVLFAEPRKCMDNGGKGTDAFMVTINPIDAGTPDVVFTPVKLVEESKETEGPHYGYYLTVIVETDYADSTKLTRYGSISANYSLKFSVLRNTRYSYAEYKLEYNGFTNYRLTNPYGFTAYASGYASVESVGFMLGGQYGSKVADDPQIIDLCVGVAPPPLPACVEGTAPCDDNNNNNNKYYWYDNLADWSNYKPRKEPPTISTATPATFHFYKSRKIDCGISYPQDVRVRVHAPDTVTFADDTVCLSMPADSTDYGARPAGGVYRFAEGANAGQPFTHKAAGEGSHRVTYTYTSQYGCVTEDTATITVEAFHPTITTSLLNNPSTISFCRGEEVTLEVGGITNGIKHTYQWYHNKDAISTGGQGNRYELTPNAAVYAAGEYAVAATSVARGCVSTANVPVKIVEKPAKPEVATMAGSIDICVGAGFKLYDSYYIFPTDADAARYQWYETSVNDANKRGIGNTYTEIKAAIAGERRFILGVVEPVSGYDPPHPGCWSYDTLNVMIRPLPAKATIFSLSAGTVGNEIRLCQNDSVTLAAMSGDGDTYSWSRTIPAGTIEDEVTNPTVTVKTAGTYSVRSTSKYGCRADAKSNPVTVMFVDRPETPLLTGGNPVCAGDTTPITAFAPAATSYQWYFVDGSISSSIDGATGDIYGATGNGSYAARAYIQYPNGGPKCPSSSLSLPLSVSLWPKPSPPVIKGDKDIHICTGVSVHLEVSSASGSPTGNKYRWYKNGASLSGMGVNGISGTLDHSQTEDVATYTAVAISEHDGEKNCTSAPSAPTTVTVHSPTVEILGAAKVDTCLGNNVTLTAKSNTTFFSSIEWYKDNIPTPVSSGALTHVVNGQTQPSTGKYYIKVTDDNGCPSPESQSVMVTIRAAATDVAITSASACTGDALTLHTNVASSTYDWYFEKTNGDRTHKATTTESYLTIPNATSTDAGKYIVRIQEGNGCISEGSGTAQVFSPPSKPDITPNALHICMGDSTKLEASSSASNPAYRWFFTGDGGSEVELLPTSSSIYVTQSGVYAAQVTSAAGCRSAKSDPVTIATHARPEPPTIITPGNPIKVCTNNATVITAFSAGATSYQWYSGVGAAQNKIANETSESYTAAVAGYYAAHAYRHYPEASLTCRSAEIGPSKEVALSQVPSPPTIDGKNSACAGQTITLVAKPNLADPKIASYRWKKGLSDIQAVYGDTCLVTQTEEASYTVSSVSEDGCVSPPSSAKNVIIRNPTVSIANNDTSICHGGTVTLTAVTDAYTSETGTYEWYKDNKEIGNANAKSYIVKSDGSPTIDKTGKYFLKVTDGNGCSPPYASNEVQVSIRGLPPTPTVGDPAPVCEGGDVTLTASPSGAGTYQWYSDNGGNPAGIGPASSDTTLRLTKVQPSSAGKYSVKITNTWGCTSEGSGTVTVYALPNNPTLSSPEKPMLTSADTVHLCAGDSTQLTAYTAGAASYQWFLDNSDGSLSTSDRLYASTAGLYSARSVSSKGCTSHGFGAVAVSLHSRPQTPTIYPESDLTSQCVNSSTTITASSSGATSFQWYTVNATGERSPILSASDYAYKVIATNDYAVRADALYSTSTYQLTCSSPFSAAKPVVLYPRPPRPMIAGNAAVCIGDTVALTATLAASNAVVEQYEWYGDGMSLSTTFTPAYSVPQSEDASYTVRAISDKGCRSDESLPLNVVTRNPSVKIVTDENASTNICFGGTVTLTAVTNEANANYTYEWYKNGDHIKNANAQSYLVRSEGNPTVSNTSSYYLYVVDEWKCRSVYPSTPVTVTLRELPPTPVVTSPPPECEGGSVALTASPSGAGSYQWSFVKNGTSTLIGAPSNDTICEIANVQPSNEGRYTVTITNDQGCTSSGSGNVVVYAAAAIPILNTSDSVHLCTGDSILLTAYAANVDHYKWYYNNGDLHLPADRFHAKMTGVYSVWSVSDRGCESRGNDEVALTIHDRPEKPTITPDGLINVCANGSITITGFASGATSYQWYNVEPVTNVHSLISGATGSNFEVRESGRYAVRADILYSNGNHYQLTCETVSAPKEVQLFPVLMPPVITGEKTLTGEKTSGCDGDVITLTASVPGNPAVASYKWYRNGTEMTSNTTSTYTITQVEAAEYKAKAVTDKSCPSEASATKEVVIRRRPTVTIADGVRETCGSAITLSAVTNPASTGGAYEWYENGVLIPGASTSPMYVMQGNVDVTVGKTASYYLFVTDRYGCSSAAASNTVEATIHGLPPIPLITADPQGVCEKEDAILRTSPSGAGTYSWFKRNGKTFDTIAITSDTSYRILSAQTSDGGVYAVEITNTHGCTSSLKSEITLSVLTLPIVNILETRACANWTEERTVNFAEPSGGAFTGWGCTNGKFIPSNVNPGEAAVTYTYSDPNGCTNSDTKTIEIIRLPNTPVVSAEGSTAVCQDSVEVTLHVNATAGESGNSYTYEWRREGFALSGETGTAYVATKEGSYDVRVCNHGLCWATDASLPVKVTVIPLPAPPVIATQSALVCPGDLTRLFVQEGEGTYQWYKGDSKKMTAIAGEIAAACNAGEVGQYAAELFKVSEEWGVGCWSELSNFITVGEHPLPTQPEIIPSQAHLYAGMDYTLTVKTPQTGEQYEWYKNDLSADLTSITFPISNLNSNDTGRYTVKAVNEHGCTIWSEAYALAWSESDLFIPNIFTPNGDGINDYFQILGLEKFVENKLEILNKRGIIVFSQRNYHNEWNGNGLPNDIYYYTLELKHVDGGKSLLRGFLHLKQ